MNSLLGFEKFLNVKLLPYQKVLLEKITKGEQTYYIVPPKIGRKYYLDNLELIRSRLVNLDLRTFIINIVP